jgi:uncharacterized protein (TIGR04255 family)
MQHKRYAKAPIVEAVIAFQTRATQTPDLARLGQFRDAVADRFPLTTPIASVTVNLPHHGGDDGPNLDNQQVGLRLADADNSRVLQVQQQGFSYSHLSPYTHWEDFSDEARQYWKQFVAQCAPETVVRIATRYINKIIIDEERIELEHYFNLYPSFPKTVGEDISGVFMQLRQEIKAVSGATATISFTDTVENAGTADAKVAFLLDFDISVEGSWSTDDGALWSVLEEFRRIKNEYFESSITDKCRSLFE